MGAAIYLRRGQSTQFPLLRMWTEICFCTAEHCTLPGKSASLDISPEKAIDAKLDSDCNGFWSVFKRTQNWKRLWGFYAVPSCHRCNVSGERGDDVSWKKDSRCEKLSEAVWRRSVCPENADFWKLSALCDKNQIGILETIKLHPRIIFTYSRIWFFVSHPRFHVPAWNWQSVDDSWQIFLFSECF